MPVIEGLVDARTRARISIDTSKAQVAAAALDAGATMVNDVTALRAAPEIAELVARHGARAMPDAHARHPANDAGRPALRRRRRRGQAVPRGATSRSRSTMASPRSGSCSTRGSGSARRPSTTSSCCAGCRELVAIGRPVLIGTSRKGFLGTLTGRDRSVRSAGGDGRHQRARVRARRPGLSRPRRRACDRRAHRRCCYGRFVIDPDDADDGERSRGVRARRRARRGRRRRRATRARATPSPRSRSRSAACRCTRTWG